MAKIQNLLVVVHLGGQRFNKLLVTVSIRVLHCALETNVEVHASEVNLVGVENLVASHTLQIDRQLQTLPCERIAH